jgi:transmembrane sensor
VLRHDRGLTAAEQDAFSQWLAADPAHRAAWAEHRWGWDELDRLAGLQASAHAVPDPDLLKPRRFWRPRFSPARSLSLSLAAAAVLTLGVYLWQRPATSREGVLEAAAGSAPLALIERRELPDGSVLELNRGAEVTEEFGPAERRVTLRRGEAHFLVAPEAARPFVVVAAGVALRAVGTAFNVRLEAAEVEVVVTEGRVAVAVADGPDRAPAGEGPVLAAGERAVVPLVAAAAVPVVRQLSPAEIAERLAWQPRLLDFSNAPLPEIVAEFNRRNPVRLTIADERLATLRLSANFRSDNVEGFVRLMVSDFGLRAERRGEREIRLLRAD